MTRNINMLRILIGIDDTDNLDSPGSGTAAENLAMALESHNLAHCEGITRHQLLVHADIPFTSHNSAMCIPATCEARRLADVISFGRSFLENSSADGSDPGLCVVIDDSHLDKDSLISFGQNAKQKVLDKQAAYALADALGVCLSEHGGTGGGVIGALAATGLRMCGNDGRYRGWLHFGRAGEATTVAELCRHDCVDAVRTEGGQALASAEIVLFAENTVKTVLMGNTRVIPVASTTTGNTGPGWTTLTKKEMKRF